MIQNGKGLSAENFAVIRNGKRLSAENFLAVSKGGSKDGRDKIMRFYD